MPRQQVNAFALPHPAQRKAASRIARLRNALDWILNQPTWFNHFALALADLGYNGQRQGISLERSIRCLPIEKKFRLARAGFGSGLPTLNFPNAKRFASILGITNYKSRSDFGSPSQEQWENLTGMATIRLSVSYQHYKEAQFDLYSQNQTLPEVVAVSLCKARSLREDCCQEARLALLDAIDRIDPNENFAAYASLWIKRRVKNYLMRESVPVKTPVNLISKTLSEESRHNQELTSAIGHGTVSLDASETSASELVDSRVAAPPIATEESEKRELVLQALDQLSEKQREVIVGRFGLEKTAAPQSLAQIATATGISRQQVFQREKRALAKLSHLLSPIQREQFEPLTRPAIA